jgi:hypothetical protein
MTDSEGENSGASAIPDLRGHLGGLAAPQYEARDGRVPSSRTRMTHAPKSYRRPFIARKPQHSFRAVLLPGVCFRGAVHAAA